MAKLFKIQAYIVDYNDEYKTGDRLEDCLIWCTQRDLNLQHLKVDGADLGEWYDEHPLNYTNCPEAEFEKYFKENTK